MAAIYAADLWCDDCADLIRGKIQSGEYPNHAKAPDDPDDETSYDSDDYPKPAGDDEASDCPQHCASDENCVNAQKLSDGSKVGLLFGELTEAGIEYVKEAIAEGGLVAEFWRDQYRDKGYDF